jgi:hypothetical protein
VFFGFAAFYALYFSPVLLGGHLLVCFGDALFYDYPALFGSRDLWDPLLFSGYPRFADPLQRLWYPLALPLSLTGWAWLWNPFLLAPYVLASCFTYGLVRRATRSALAGAVAGLVFGLCGFMVSHMPHPTITHAACWLPLALWALAELRERFHRGWLAALAVAVANSFLAGHAQTFANGLALAGLFTLWHLPGAPARWWRFGLIAAAGVLLGLGLGAVQLVPTAELIPHSARADMTFEEFTGGSLPPGQLPMFTFPYAYGGADLSPRAWCEFRFGAWPEPFEPFFATIHPETTGFCGLLGGVLAAVGLLGGPRTRATWFWVLAGAAGLVLALGAATPLGHGLYLVPAFNRFRCPGRFVMWVGLAAAVLAGHGAAALPALSRRRGAAALLLGIALVAAAVGLAWYTAARQMASSDLFQPAPQAYRSPLPWRNPAVGLPLAALLAGLPFLWLRWARPGRISGAGLLAAVAVELGLFAWFAGWRTASPPAAAVAHPPESVTRLAQELGPRGERVLSTWRPSTRLPDRRACPLQLDTLPANLTSCWGLANGQGYTPLGLRRYLRLVPCYWLPGPGRSAELFACRVLVLAVRTRWAHGVEWDEYLLDAPHLIASGPDAVTFRTPVVTASRVSLMADLGNVATLPDGTAAVEVVVDTPSGPLPPLLLRTGEHVVDCFWERTAARHRLPALTDTLQVRDSSGKWFHIHHSVAHLDLGGRVAVTGVRLRPVAPQAVLHPLHLTLVDDVTGACSPVWRYAGDPDHWRVHGLVAGGTHLLVENRRPLRRAWLASRVVRLPSEDVAKVILGEAPLPDGTAFDPYQVALVEEDVPFTASAADPGAEARVVRHAPHRVTVATRSAAASFLVLGDVYYPGWEARLDGRPVPVYRADYALRGVVVPPGEHTVEFVFRPRSFFIGATISAAAALVLLTLLLIQRRRTVTIFSQGTVGNGLSGRGPGW